MKFSNVNESNYSKSMANYPPHPNKHSENGRQHAKSNLLTVWIFSFVNVQWSWSPYVKSSYVLWSSPAVFHLESVLYLSCAMLYHLGHIDLFICLMLCGISMNPGMATINPELPLVWPYLHLCIYLTSDPSPYQIYLPTCLSSYCTLIEFAHHRSLSHPSQI